MNQEVQDLLDQAKAIAVKNKKSMGTRYPKKLKTITNRLVNVHGLSYEDVMAFVPVSKGSVERWSTTKNQTPFKKINIKKESPKVKARINKIDIHISILAAQVLLLSAQLFLH